MYKIYFESTTKNLHMNLDKMIDLWVKWSWIKLLKARKILFFFIISITGILFSIMDSGVAQKMGQTLDPLEKQKTVKILR